MNGVNKVILVGTLGRDPEVRFTPSGNAIANLSVATSEQWTDKQSGQRQERTEWHRVVIFGKLAEIAGQYLAKSRQVYLEGKLQTRKWTDQSGQERYSTEVVIDSSGVMQMIGGSGNASGGSGGGQRSSSDAGKSGRDLEEPVTMKPTTKSDNFFDDDPYSGFDKTPF